ncbi:MAG: YkvA family protein [Chloroflexota bacterium]
MNWTAWQQRAKALKREIYALYLAYRDPRLPWYARLVAMVVVGYAFSPIDLIPDPIPVLGYLDDLILIPLGVALALKLIPPPVMADCREQAALRQEKPANWVAAGVIITIWLLLAALITLCLMRLWRDGVF